MRRAQIDALEQAVRNFATNPSLRTMAGSTIVTTNFFTNPRVETTNGLVTVRTNLCTNPRGVNTFSNYGAATTQTPNVPITGHPEGITTALRVEYTSGSNPGVIIMSGVEASTTYALSAWVYHEVLPATGSADFAQQSVTSNQGSPPLVQGQWTKHTWVRNTGASTNPFGFRYSQQGTSGGSFLITGIMVERSTQLNPFFDGAGALRTNLATDARATVFNSPIGWRNTRWFGNGNPAGTHSLMTGRTDGPLPQITTYARKTWTSATSPSANGDSGFEHIVTPIPATPGEQFTVTSYLRPSSAGKNLQHSYYYWDASNVQTRATGALTVSAPAGQWTKLVSTITIPGTAVKWAVASDVQGGPVWLQNEYLDGTGLMIERTDTAYDGFYEGTGDYTYAWTGTADASTSVQRGVSLSAFTAPYMSRSVAYQSAEWPGAGKSIRITATQSTDGTTNASYAEFAVGGLNVGSVYYLSAKSYIKAPLTGGTIGANSRKVSYTGATPPSVVNHLSTHTNTAGVQEYKGSFTAATTTHTVRLQMEGYEGGGEMWWKDIAVTDQQGNYFDGTFAPDSDYTYAWAGAANASASRRSSTVPYGCSSTSTASTIRSTHTEAGETMARWLAPSYTLAANWRVATISNQAFDHTKIKAGGVYTLHLLWRYGGGWSASGISFLMQDGGATNSIVGTWLTETTTDLGNGWKLTRKPFRAAIDGRASTVVYCTLPTVATGAADCWFDIKRFGIYEGRYEGDFVDGSTHPLSLAKWDGTPDASTSVSYPPGLHEIAGKPAVDLNDTAGRTTGGVAIPVDGFAARTIYLAYEVTGQTQNYPNYGIYGQNATKGYTLQTGPVGSTNLFPRLDFPGGDANRSFTHAGGKTANRVHVTATAFPQGLGSLASCLDGAADVTTSLNPGATGWDDGRATLSSGADGKGWRMLVYYAQHDRATRLAISRYLGNLYGAQVA